MGQLEDEELKNPDSSLKKRVAWQSEGRDLADFDCSTLTAEEVNMIPKLTKISGLLA